MEARPCHTLILQVSVEACSRPMTPVVATQMDLGWIPLEPDFLTLAGDWWVFSGGTFTNILDEIHTRTVNMEWTKASTHLDGNGLEQGVDTCGYHKQHAWLVRNEMHGKTGLMKVAAAGGLGPAARLRAADERYDGLCQDAWQKVSRLKKQCYTEFGNAPVTQPAGFSVHRRNGARRRRSSRSLPASGCEVWFAVERDGTFFGCRCSMTWEPDVYFCDGSGGIHSKDPRLTQAG